MKLNVNATIEKAEKEGQIYPIKSGWKTMFTFAGILTCLLILTIPLGIWIIIAGRNARLGLTDEGFAYKGIGSHGWRWDAIETFDTAGHAHIHFAGGGLVGALAGAALSTAVAAKTQGLKGPLRFKLKGKRGWKIIPAHTIQNSYAMAEEMERRTGLQILPKKEETKAPAESAGNA
jgi:hypothetical protein